MTSGEAFDLYSKPKAKTSANRRKESRRYLGESSSDPSKKKAQTEDPPAPVPSKETTPPPAPDPTPPAPFDPTPPAPINPMPPDQSGKTQGEVVLNTAYNLTNDKLKKLSRHRRNQEAFSNVSEEMSAKHAEEIKAIEGRLVE
ncbi:anther-specific proline-rich protein APG-like [Humulus lupulus]|uniref:anther-specific proline-rich protein APG-like n=1 Tax=Humulus lupulus TaxID=3486 RepID=UPI002B417E33|nr:anther-specific proline-rich protein APG-like [Humulus lupulus]